MVDRWSGFRICLEFVDTCVERLKMMMYLVFMFEMGKQKMHTDFPSVLFFALLKIFSVVKLKMMEL